jgi:hypothetical protein
VTTRRKWIIAAFIAAGVAVYFVGPHLMPSEVIETSIQPDVLIPNGSGDTTQFSVGFTWIEGGYCVGQFEVKATESANQVRVGQVISRKYPRAARQTRWRCPPSATFWTLPTIQGPI